MKTIKKKALNRVLKELGIGLPILFFVLFLYTVICGSPQPFHPASAYRKCECIPLKEASKDIPFIFFFCLGGSLLYLPLGYEYYIGKYRKEANRKEEKLAESESGNKEEDDTLLDE